MTQGPLQHPLRSPDAQTPRSPLMISGSTLVFAFVFLVSFFDSLNIINPAGPASCRPDIEPIHPEAHHRWLRAPEICEILQNSGRFHVSSQLLNRPSGGSLFLFDRNTLRHFRRDGHKWGKKEGHEKLKVEGHEVLNCYYARGEENRLLRRRCYWMLQGELSDMVLVHYREVEENAPSSSRPGNDNDNLVGWQDENIPYFQTDGASTDFGLFSSQALEHEKAAEAGSHVGQSSTTPREIYMDPINDDLPHQFQENIAIQYWVSVYESTMTGQENGLIDEAATSVFGGTLEVGNHSGGSQGWQVSNSDFLITSNWTVSQNLDNILNLGQDHYLFGGEPSSCDGVRLHNTYIPEPHTQLLQDDWEQHAINDSGSSLEQYSHGNLGSVAQENSWEQWNRRGLSDIPTQKPFDNDVLDPFISSDELFSINNFGPNWAYSGFETDPTGITFLTLACLGITIVQALFYYVF